MKNSVTFSDRFTKTETLNLKQTTQIKGGDDKRPIIGGGTLPPPPPLPNGGTSSF